VQDIASFDRRSGMVFVGYGRNPSNTIGLAWFFEQVFPTLDKSVARAPIYIVGAASEEAVRSLQGRIPADARVIAVPKSDDAALRHILNSARVMIVPVFSTGLTTKVLLGMSHGLPVVTTHMAAAGYKWSGKKGMDVETAMAVASSPSTFAAKLTQVYSDENEWTTISSNGLQLAKTHVSGEQFKADVTEMVATLRGSPMAAKAPMSKSVKFIGAAMLSSHESALLVSNKFELADGGTGMESSSSGNNEGMSSSGTPEPTCTAQQVTDKFNAVKVACSCEAAAACITKLCLKTTATGCKNAAQAVADLFDDDSDCKVEANLNENAKTVYNKIKTCIDFGGASSTVGSFTLLASLVLAVFIALRL
jgi:hypothetical protein